MTNEIRLGVIVPSVNIVVEEWYPRVVPEGVSVHFARMLITDGSSPEKIIAMDREDGMRDPPDRQLPARRGCLWLHRIEHRPGPTTSTSTCAARSGISPGLRRRPRPTAYLPPAGRSD